ncbi:MAG TPA: four helix bundle protein [Ferruginibacter sp.]|nr:four helix bundle protein [Ferruginibacter sp.]HRO16998.1 four helix bundle protein [Ferruginibacter sp.]
MHKLGITQKECNETMYWLELLHATEYLEREVFDSLFSDAQELIRLLTAIIKYSKGLNINH